jgi:hypothetical protein
MGTNYYWVKPAPPPCITCGRRDADRWVHIGKRSAGWKFSLHVGDDAPDDLLGWIEKWNEPGTFIVTEYREELSPREMLDIVTGWMPNGRSHTTVDQSAVDAGSYDMFRGWFS